MSLQNRADKKRLNIIIVAEGAIDSHNKAITPDYIKDVSMVEKPGLDSSLPTPCSSASLILVLDVLSTMTGGMTSPSVF